MRTDGQMEGQTDMTKLTIAYAIFGTFLMTLISILKIVIAISRTVEPAKSCMWKGGTCSRLCQKVHENIELTGFRHN